MAKSDSHLERGPARVDDAPTVLDAGLYRTPGGRPASPDASTDLQSRGGDESVPSATPPAKNLENQKTVISKGSPGGTGWPSPFSSAELGALLEGNRLDHFVLEKFVGGGGMGAVFRGRDELLGRVVAVKVLSRDQGADPETLRRFKNEAQSAARLDHENIARVFFVGEDDGWNFIVFEFIDGINLRELVERDGPLSLELALDYTIQVAEALEHAAERDVVHRDIKPSNVLVTKDGCVKLVDMGLARFHQMEAGHSDLTASGVTLGTFDYISPEQASDPRRADVRSDLYSLGCTLFFMLTGRPPFPHGTVLQKLLAHSGEAPPDVRELRGDLPDELGKILHRLLAKRPEQRYARPGELIGELLNVRDRLGLASRHPASHGVTEAKGLTWRQKGAAWAIPLALLLFLVFGWEVFLSGSYGTGNQPPDFEFPSQGAREAMLRNTPLSGGYEGEAAGLANAASPGSAESPSVASGGLPASNDAPRSTSPSGDAVSRVETPLPPPGADGSDESSAASDHPDAKRPPVSTDSGSGGSVSPSHAGAVVESPSASTSEPDDPPPLPPAASDVVSYRMLVVGDAAQLGKPGPHAKIFPTLKEALQSEEYQSADPPIKVIEIRASQHVEPSPLRVELSPGRELTIRGVPQAASAGPLPLVSFDASSADLPSGDHGMIEVASGKLKLENIHLELKTGEAVAAGDMALLRVRAGDVKHLHLESCILTVENQLLDDTGRVAFLDLVAPANNPDMPTKLAIDLDNCVVRGGANMLRMRKSVPVKLKWDNGLLATSERLLLAHGSSQTWEETISVALTHVTVSTGQGLCRLRDSIDQPHQPALELECSECVISAGSSTLVEHDGVDDPEKFRQALVVSGSTNHFDGVDHFWRVYVNNSEQQDLGWDWPTWRKKMAMSGGMLSKFQTIRWLRDRSDVPSLTPHLLGLDDFLPDPEPDNPVMQGDPMPAGFKPDLLPPLYRVPPAPKPQAEEDVSAPA